MPNGVDKNLVRLCSALDGFRDAFGRWPDRVLVSAESLDDLRRLLGPERMSAIDVKLRLVPAPAEFRAEDESGERWFDYGRGIASGPDSDDRVVGRDDSPPARTWLGLH